MSCRVALCRRYRVFDAWYSTPEAVDPTLRYSQQPCEENRYCVDGVARTCNRTVCFPRPVTAVVREALPGELDEFGVDYYVRRLPGVSEGDVIEVQFDDDTIMPALNNSIAVTRLLNFSVPFASDGIDLKARWVSPSLLFLTVISGRWSQPGVTDPLLTRVGLLSFNLLASGRLRWVSRCAVSLCHELVLRRLDVYKWLVRVPCLQPHRQLQRGGLLH
jgi:hypothetical protein